MKRALITGAEGFIGSHLTELLLKKKFKVIALIQYNSFNNFGWLEGIKENKDLEIISGDVRDSYFCKNIVQDIDIIFHLAALIAIPYSYLAPESYIDTNVKGTLNICQAAKDAGGIRVIHTSTSEVYGSSLYVPMDEKHPLQPQSPYSASKIAADAIAMSFFYTFQLPVTVLRPFNTYGPRQSARAIIPSIIIQMLNGVQEIKIGDISPTRDFNYVSDTCRAFLTASENPSTIGCTLNAGSNSEISILNLFKLIKDLLKSDSNYLVQSERLRPPGSEVKRLYSNSSELNRLTGYKQNNTLEEGLKKTITWFEKTKNLNFYKSDIYNV